MKHFRVTFEYSHPYPIRGLYNVEAGQFKTAISRAMVLFLRDVRQRHNGRLPHIKQIFVRVDYLGKKQS